MAWPDFCRSRADNKHHLHLAGFGLILTNMAYLDPYQSSPEHLDSVRRSHFQRSGSRPDGKLRRPPSETQKAHTRASGRLRTAAYRCNLDTKKKPESNVVGMALLAAVV